MQFPSHIDLNEVVLRDGLQLEEKILSVEEKSKLFDYLLEAGIQSMEFGAFVHPDRVQQMRNSGELFTSIKNQSEHVKLLGLVPNLKGIENANAHAVKDVNFVFSASETHNLQNVQKSTQQSIEELININDYCMKHNIRLNVAIATSFGCPFEGKVPEARLINIINELLELKIDTFTLADTTGMANPKQVYRLLNQVQEVFPDLKLNLYFHNTRGMGLSNILASIQAGIHRFDTALGGVGGCPFAPGATGNVCTEDVVHMLHHMDIETNINLEKLLKASRFLEEVLGHQTPSYLLKAGPSSKQYPIPS